MICLEIKKYRELAGITPAELARIMGVDQAAVTRWERGLVLPRAAKIPKLADLFGCTIDQLYGREPPAESS